MIKRLFIFAGYNSSNTINSALTYYVKKLSEIGDVIVHMDCDISDSELNKISPFTIFSSATRHQEYDFGSYKRGYIYARDNELLQNYDYIYFVNDSVFGPLSDLESLLKNYENTGKNAYGMVYRTHKKNPHLQSWFLGMDKKTFLSDEFDKFICNVKREKNKYIICDKYESGFTRLLIKNNFSFYYSFIAHGHDIYNKPKKMFKMGMPFFKTIIANRYNGMFGAQINYILSHINSDIKNIIIKSIDENYGNGYAKKFLTKNPFKTFTRFLKYNINKGLKK